MSQTLKRKGTTQTDTDGLNKRKTGVEVPERLVPILSSVKAANRKDRNWSSNIIKDVIQDPAHRLTLLRHGIVNALVERLTDHDIEIKHDALGSIHALIVEEGRSLCISLYRKGILDLIDRAYDGTDTQTEISTANELLLVKELAYIIINRICEECQEAADSDSAKRLLLRATISLKHGSHSVSLDIYVAKFIRTLVTDRPNAIDCVLDFEHIDVKDYVEAICNKVKHLSSSSDSKDADILRLVLGDIVISLCDSYIEGPRIYPPIQLVEIIRFARNIFISLVENGAVFDNQETIPETLLSASRSLSSIATYLDSYLEIYPGATPPENDSLANDTDPFEDDDIDKLDGTIIKELFVTIPLFQQLQLPIHLIPYVLETINDIAWTMTLRIPTWGGWHTIVDHFCDFAISRLEGIVSLGDDTTSTFLGCIWACAKSIPGRFSLDADDVLILEGLYKRSSTEEVRVRTIGILGVAAQAEVESCRYITEIFMREIMCDVAVVVVEIMDAMMEIFADGEKVHDEPVFVQGRILQKLKQMLPQLRKRVKSIRDPDVRERAYGVLENFIEFLKYKEVEARQRCDR